MRARGVTIPRDLFESIAFRQLSALEYRLLIELIALQADSKTDGVRCSARWAAKVCSSSKSPAGRALACLEERGFIVRISATERGAPMSWRITCLPFLGDPATRDYRDTSLTWRSIEKGRAKAVRGQPFFTPEMESGSVVKFEKKRALT
jgi:hypothetical protein